MTSSEFERYMRAEVKKGIPFVAYHYSGGCGLMRTGSIEQEPKRVYRLYYGDGRRPQTYENPYEAERAIQLEQRRRGVTPWIEEEYVQPKPVQAKKSSISAFRREIARLGKRESSLCIVEFDGSSLMRTGGIEK